MIQPPFHSDPSISCICVHSHWKALSYSSQGLGETVAIRLKTASGWRGLQQAISTCIHLPRNGSDPNAIPASVEAGERGSLLRNPSCASRADVGGRTARRKAVAVFNLYWMKSGITPGSRKQRHRRRTVTHNAPEIAGLSKAYVRLVSSSII